MNAMEFGKYARLNDLAEQGGVVIFGCGEDTSIPTCELRQAFSLDEKVYNRSFSDMTIDEAADAYNRAVAPLDPETVLLHLGQADRQRFAEDASSFDQAYIALIRAIRAQDKDCRIVVVSLKNYDNDPAIEEMNRHLRFIADSEKCAFGDIAEKKVWNPKSSMRASSFVHSLNFPFQNQEPVYDLVKIMFCCA